jgi:predicted  nucleic acid-binding Zn-ribbon protein
MEHECETCGTAWFDNKYGGTCPKCGSWEVASFFDEDSGSYDSDEPDWEEVEDE